MNVGLRLATLEGDGERQTERDLYKGDGNTGGRQRETNRETGLYRGVGNTGGRQ